MFLNSLLIRVDPQKVSALLYFQDPVNQGLDALSTIVDRAIY